MGMTKNVVCMCIVKDYFVTVSTSLKKFTLYAEHTVCISTNVLL